MFLYQIVPEKKSMPYWRWLRKEEEEGLPCFCSLFIRSLNRTARTKRKINKLICIDSCLQSPTTITILQFPELYEAQTVSSPFYWCESFSMSTYHSLFDRNAFMLKKNLIVLWTCQLMIAVHTTRKRLFLLTFDRTERGIVDVSKIEILLKLDQ